MLISSDRSIAGFLLFATLSTALLIGLGLWQLDRRETKHATISRMETGLAANPEDLPAKIADPWDWDYRRVQLVGRYLHDREVRLHGQIRDGRLGARILTPLVRDGAPPVMIDRGWVPEDRIDPATRPDTQPSGTVTVAGITRLPAQPAWYRPENRPDVNVWLWIDLPAIATATGLADLAPILVQATGPSAPDPLPIPAEPRIDIPDNHLQYAITWFSLAAAVVMLSVAVVRARLRERRSQDAAEARGTSATSRG